MTAVFNNFELRMTKAQAHLCSHAGPCDVDVAAAVVMPALRRQLDKIGADAIRKQLRDYGAWDDDELASDADNRERIVWIAAGDIVEAHDGA